MINIKDFASSLLKIDNKIMQNHLHLQHWIYYTKKIDDYYEDINSINPLYPIIGKADGYIEEKNVNKYLLLQIVIKKYWQNYKTLGRH